MAGLGVASTQIMPRTTGVLVVFFNFSFVAYGVS
jgi:hypothetical protein